MGISMVLIQTLKPDPQSRPSNQPLKPNPQKLPQKESLTLKSDPQNAWQTLKKFDYPKYPPLPMKSLN